MPDEQHPKSPGQDRGDSAKPGWSEEEKGRGTPQAAEAGDKAGTAGSADPAATPTDDRARTEQAAMATEQAKKGS